jgi:thymidylate synthase
MNMEFVFKGLLYSPEVSPRGLKIKEVLGVQLTFGRGQDLMKHLHIPDNSSYVNEELKWYLRGKREDLSIMMLAKIWEQHLSRGGFNSNYGVYLFNQGRFYDAMDELKRDRDSRRAVALIGDASMFKGDEPDVPCTQSIQFLIRLGEMNAIVSMRSQDVWFGLRNDLPFFQLLIAKAAKWHDVERGQLLINVGSLHVYERHWPRLQQVIDSNDPVTYEAINFERFL